jgi:2-hydroxy-3-oxopropionate reductase
MRIAFIGLGVMGLPMVHNLLREFEVVAYNRSPARVELARAAGAIAAASIQEAVTGADAVVTMLPDSPDVLAVYDGDDGVLASVGPGTLLIDMSTISPTVAADLHARAGAAGQLMLDAPVSGGEQGAKDATLSIMAGGSVAAFEQAQPILRAVGKTIMHVGAGGTGQTVKAANQLLVAGTIELVAEVLVFLNAYGVDLATAVEVLNGGLAGSAILSRKAPAMIAGDFAPGFRVALHNKDLGIYRDAARAQEVFSPVGALITELMSALRASGGGGLDHGALITQVDRLSGGSRWSQA